MDLKTLLLDSISTGRILKSHKRLHLGKKCYSIEYEVQGKYLTVKAVKQVCTKLALRERIMKRKRVWHRRNELKSKPELAHTQVQTSCTELLCQATETEKQTTACRDQQTIRKHVRKQGTQTDGNNSSQGMQTECRTKTRCSQTEWYLSSMSAQTEIEYCSHQVQTEIAESAESMRIEQDAVIFLLNEIGEMIINQNHLLHNNSTLLGQISEMVMLSRMVSRQNAATKTKWLERRRKSRRHVRFCGNYPGVCLCKRRCRPCNRRSKAIQVMARFSQTGTSTESLQGVNRNTCCSCF